MTQPTPPSPTGAGRPGQLSKKDGLPQKKHQSLHTMIKYRPTVQYKYILLLLYCIQLDESLSAVTVKKKKLWEFGNWHSSCSITFYPNKKEMNKKKQRTKDTYRPRQKVTVIVSQMTLVCISLNHLYIDAKWKLFLAVWINISTSKAWRWAFICHSISLL